ncbi:MAG: hypothetical protein ACT4UP_10850 [Gammaproteobacteria bacterium]
MIASNRLPVSWRNLSASLVLAFAPLSGEAMETAASSLAEGVDQLRHAVGTWNVTTIRYREDGKVAERLNGTYQFEWVVPDRVVSGRANIPSIGPMSGLLFYYNERRGTLEIASVGADGQLVVMTGAPGEELRTSAPPAADGSKRQLRFTRFNVERNCFESRLDVSTDGGASWRPGNHLRFVRATSEAAGMAGLRFRKPSRNYVPLT